MASTIKDIRKMTGLSLATISKYLNGGNVLPENKKKIDEAVKQLDYHVNEVARSLVTRKSRSIGFVVNSLTSPFDSTLVSYADKVLRKAGYSLVICDSNYSSLQEAENVQFLAQKNIDGLLVLPVSDRPHFLDPMKAKGIPVVTADRVIEGYDSVITDNERIGRDAAEYLIRKGHRKISIIYPVNVVTGTGRFRGFVDTLKKYGIELPSAYIKPGDETSDFAYKAIRELMRLPEPPTAVITTNYDLNLGAVMGINEAGLTIPDDISMIGVDNLLLPNLMRPALTYVIQPMQEIGETAAARLMELIEQKKKDNHQPMVKVIPSFLREGQSVKDLTEK
ncbi:MAG: LacI family DNA-binding transcriptional regulator [Eubacterium sp.]|nr:LacI family DNA-binding transcriptional regulator [Eubacterium sp.]